MLAYIIERTTDGGSTEQYLGSNARWHDTKADAETFHDLEEAQALADAFSDHAAMRGNGYLFNVGEMDSSKISLAPNWQAAAHIYLMALENGTPSGTQAGKDGIEQMARQMDDMVKRLTVLEANL